MTMIPLKKKKRNINTIELYAKYRTYKTDHMLNRMNVVYESLEHRMTHPSLKQNNFNARIEVLRRYFPYVQEKDLPGVSDHMCEWFSRNKNLPQFIPYYHKPNMEFIFKEQLLNINPLPEVAYQTELPTVLEEINNTVVVDTKDTPYEVGEIIVKYGDRMYKSPCHSNEELNRYIDLSKEFL